MPERINKDIILQPGTVEAVLKDLDRIVAGAKERLGQIKTESKGLFDQFGQPMKISGESINQLNKAGESVKKLSLEQQKLIAYERQATAIKSQLTRELAKQSNENIRAAANLKTQREATRQLIAEQQKLNGTFKAGFFSNLISQVKTLAASYLGLYAAFNVAKSVFSTTKELNVLSQSYKFLIKDADELAQTQGFLSDITQRYGLELISTSQSYLKFRASIAGSNFDLAESQKLFESVAKAGSVLGLNVQRMELIFLALEQMISKGTISTEELRRQLGDNLPGAMRIMADALKVTIPELLKMIKNNEVLASEALPKFRVQLEKAYGIESVKTVDNLQTAINNLKNTWTLFVQSLSASDEFMAILTALTKVLGGLSGAANINGMKIFSEQLERVKNDIKGFVDVGDIELAFKTLSSSFDQSLNQLGKYKMELAFLEGEVNKFIYNPLKTGLSEKDAKQRIRDLKEYVKGFESLVKELDITLGDGNWLERLFPKVPKDTGEDAITGIIAKLEEQKKINDELISQAESGERIKELNLINTGIEKQIKFYRELGEEQKLLKPIDTDNVTEERNKREQKLVKEGNDKLHEIQADNHLEMLRDREDFAKSIGLTDKNMYDTELQYLKEFHDKGLISDREYLVHRVSLWMKYNKLTIDSVDQFAQSFNNLLAEIKQGQIDAAQKEVDLQEDKLSKLKSQLDEEKKAKDEGKRNDVDRIIAQIAETQKLRDKANIELAKAKKREAQIQLAGQASDIITASANIIEGWTEINPVAGVLLGLAQVGALITAFVAYKNKINSISKYAEGTESVEGPGTETSDSIPARLSKHERVVDAKRNRQLGDISNDELVDAVDLWRLNFNTDLSKSNYQRYDSASEMLTELKQSRITNEAMLEHMKNTPVIAVMPDGRLIEMYGKYKTKVVTLK